MAFADYLHGPRYKQELAEQAKVMDKQRAMILKLNEERTGLKQLLDKVGAMDLAAVQALIVQEKARMVQLDLQHQQKLETLKTEQDRLAQLQREVLVVEEDLLLESFALYKPKFSFTHSAQYKLRLDDIRADQKQMVKDGTAATGNMGWTVNNSPAEGKKLVKDMIKLVIRSFNNEADYCVDNVKFDNIELGEKRITQSCIALNKLGRIMDVKITDRYLGLKLDELRLAHEFQVKKQEEKEEAKRVREELKEQQKLEQEIRAAREKIAKERKHFQAALKDLNQRLVNASSDEERATLSGRIEELSANCAELDGQEKQIDYREQNAKAGYVYVISNVGAFGEGVFKIGMTRRLEPMDRVDELGDASVPFPFDVHALVFSDNAPSLENKLHQTFSQTRLNKINQRKEFFRAELKEIEAVIRENFDAAVEFVHQAPAEHFRESCRMG